MSEKKQFDKQIDFQNAHRLTKVYLKKDKNNQPYFMGDFNYNNVITIRKATGQYAKEGEYEIQIVPVKYTKKEQSKQQPKPTPATIEMEDVDGDSVPF